MQPQNQCQLLQLPTELQLIIFEYAVIEYEPLLVNCPCDSSYIDDDDEEQWMNDQQLWRSGEKLPPLQPPLTQTCSSIRSITLPMFYKENSFRAHYCHSAEPHMALKWLKLIGSENRKLLRDFCFWDWNESYDEWSPTYLLKLKRSEIFRGMGGNMNTLELEAMCCHRVAFGDGDEDHYDLVPGLFEKLNMAE